MLSSSLCDFCDACILVKGTMAVPNTAGAGAAANNTNKKVIFKSCAPITNCVSQINNTQVYNAKDIDIVLPMCNLIEYSDNYSKTSRSLWQYCKDITAANNDDSIVEFNGANATDSLNFKAKMIGQTEDNGKKEVEIMIPLKYLSNFWWTLRMSLINCKIDLILNWSENCVVVFTDVADQGATFLMTEVKLYVPVFTLSTQDNAKLLQQLKLGLKKPIG